MRKLEIVTNDFDGNAAERASEVRTWRNRYTNIVTELGALGSLVHVNRVLESDSQIAPYSFVRYAVHDFIFPPQHTTISSDNSEVEIPVLGFEQRREDITYAYDEAQVKGRLRVRYDDSRNCAAFSVEDLMDGSRLSSQVLDAIAQTGLQSPVDA